MKVLAELLDSMTSICYNTTWSEAQFLLLENTTFKNDVCLLGEFIYLIPCFVIYIIYYF